METTLPIEGKTFNVNYDVNSGFEIENYDQMYDAFKQLNDECQAMEITEDNIKEAKAKKTELNKISKAFNERRIDTARPFTDQTKQFKQDVDSLIKLLDGAKAHIQVNLAQYQHATDVAHANELANLINEMAPNYEIQADEVTIDNTWHNSSGYTKKTGKPTQALINKVAEAMKEVQRQHQQVEQNKNVIRQMTKRNHLDPSAWLVLVEQGQPLDEIIDRIENTLEKRRMKLQETKEVVDRETGEIMDESIHSYVYHIIGITDTQQNALEQFLDETDITFNIEEA